MKLLPFRNDSCTKSGIPSKEGVIVLLKILDGVALHQTRKKDISLPELPVTCFYHVYAKEEISYTVRKHGYEQTPCEIEDQTIGYTSHNPGQPEIMLEAKEDRCNHK